MLTNTYLQSALFPLKEFISKDTQILQGNGYDGVIAILENLRSVEFPCVILEAGGSGSCQLIEGPVDTFTQSLWVMGQLGRSEDEALLFSQMKALARKVTAIILQGAAAGVPEVAGIDWSRYSYMQRYGGPNARGYELIFTFKENFSLEVSPADLKPQLKRVSEFLYGVDFYSLDYAKALEYFKENNPVQSVGACSSVHAGNFFGGNLDWFYDNEVEFVVRTPRKEGRLATLGIAGLISNLTKDAVENGLHSDIHWLIPFCLNDGINEAGVYCKTNVVPDDKGTTTQTIPEAEVIDEICSSMLVRYVLDKFRSASDAVEYLQQHVCVYASKKLKDMHYEAHWMIGDSQHCYVIEIIDNHIISNECDVMTNFFIDGVTFNEDGKVWTPDDVASGHLASDNGITEHGSGLERFNLAIEMLPAANSKAGMRALMNALLYSKTYLSAPVVADPVWHTEYVGQLTVDDPASAFSEALAIGAEKYLQRDRNIPETETRTWHSTHSSVYDVNAKKLYLLSQEDSIHEFEFALMNGAAGL